nr:hypothetical protein [Tanacetum cinerariifolium]
MHTSRDDYLINTLRFVSAKEATQIYGAILPESLTSPEMKKTKAYMTYLGFPTGATPPKIARKFKKASISKKNLNPNIILGDKEPKSAKKKTSGVVIRDTHVESLSKRKEKVDVPSGKGIELLSEVALTEEAQYEEVRKKSLRDFHKTHPSGSGTVIKIAPCAAKSNLLLQIKEMEKDEDESNNEHDPRSEGSDQDKHSGDDNTQSDSEKESDSEHETDENESGFESDQEENEEEIGDDEEEEGTSLLKPRPTILMMKQRLLIKLKRKCLTLPLVIQRMVTESLDHAILAKESSQTQSSYEAAASLTKFELKKILIKKMDKSESYLVALEHRKCYDGLIKSYELEKTFFFTYDKVYSLKRSRKDKDKDEDPSAGSDRGLKKMKTSKDAEPTKDQEENSGNDDEEPKGKVASERDWFTKPKRPQEPTILIEMTERLHNKDLLKSG